MATKQQILADLALLPLNKLETLQAYSQFLIIPQEDLVSNVTMLQMRTKLLELADIHFPSWTDRSATDFGMFLSELYCLFSEKDFWYINGFAQQTHLSKMSLYSSAFIRSSELGWRPNVIKGSTCSVDIVFPAGTNYQYQPGELIIEVTGGLRFTNITAFTAPMAGGTVNVSLRQGEYFRDTASFNGRSVDIRRPGVNIDTMKVTVDGILYTRVQVFGQSGNTSTHYMVLPEEDGKCSVYFGEDGYGLKPALDQLVEVTAVVGVGTAGNFPTNLANRIISQNNSRPVTSVTLVTSINGTGAYNAVDPSTIAAMRVETKAFFNSRKALLNRDTALEWLLAQPEVGNGQVIVLGTAVNVYFINKSGLVPTAQEQTDLITRMNPLVSNGVNATYNATTFVNSSPTSLTASYLSGYNPTEIESEIKQIVQDYTNGLIHAQYGKNYDLTELSSLLINSIAGVQNVVFNTVAGVPAANITVNATSILSTINTANITVTLNAI